MKVKKQKVSSEPDPIDEEQEKRTNHIGLFNFAMTYWSAAKHLQESKWRATHPRAPVSFLYFHAIELFLKSFLRLQGMSVKELSMRQYGHNYGNLKKATATFGLSFDDEDIEVLELMADTNAVIRSRYISTGMLEGPSIEALERTCKSLYSNIHDSFVVAGIPMRRK